MGESAVSQPVLITAIIALAGVIAYLFKLYVDHQKESSGHHGTELRLVREEKSKLAEQIAQERASWATKELRMVADHETEINELKLEYETKHKELVQHSVQTLEALRMHYQEREDLIRKEFADTVVAMTAHAERAANATAGVLDKIYDRFLGPRPRSRGGG